MSLNYSTPAVQLTMSEKSRLTRYCQRIAFICEYAYMPRKFQGLGDFAYGALWYGYDLMQRTVELWEAHPEERRARWADSAHKSYAAAMKEQDPNWKPSAPVRTRAPLTEDDKTRLTDRAARMKREEYAD